MTETSLKILEVLLPILMGLGFRTLGIFGNREGEVLRRFVVRVAVPLLIFFAMYRTSRQDMAAMPQMMACMVSLTAALFLIGWLCSRFVDGVGRKTALHACITFGNYGWLGFGVARVLQGEQGLQRAIFFTMLWWPCFYGFGLLVGFIHTRQRKGGVPIGQALKVILPALGAIGLGLLFNLMGWQTPQSHPCLLERVLVPFGNMTVPLILFSVGLMLDLKAVHTAIVPALVVSMIALVAAPLIGVTLAGMFTHDPKSYAVAILQAAMPVATFTPALAENYEMDLTVANTAIVVSTALSMLTLPVVALTLL